MDAWHHEVTFLAVQHGGHHVAGVLCSSRHGCCEAGATLHHCVEDCLLCERVLLKDTQGRSCTRQYQLDYSSAKPRVLQQEYLTRFYVTEQQYSRSNRLSDCLLLQTCSVTALITLLPLSILLYSSAQETFSAGLDRLHMHRDIATTDIDTKSHLSASRRPRPAWARA